MAKETATVIELSESTKNLLAGMHFEEIPEKANYIAFFADGQAQFFEYLSVAPDFGTFVLVSMYRDVLLEF